MIAVNVISIITTLKSSEMKDAFTIINLSLRHRFPLFPQGGRVPLIVVVLVVPIRAWREGIIWKMCDFILFDVFRSESSSRTRSCENKNDNNGRENFEVAYVCFFGTRWLTILLDIEIFLDIHWILPISSSTSTSTSTLKMR